MATFTHEQVHRELPPLLSTPRVESTTFFELALLFEFTALWVYRSRWEVGYVYTREPAQSTSTTPLDPIIRVDYSIQIESMLELTPLLEFTSLWVYPLPREDVYFSTWKKQSACARVPSTTELELTTFFIVPPLLGFTLLWVHLPREEDGYFHRGTRHHYQSWLHSSRWLHY